MSTSTAGMVLCGHITAKGTGCMHPRLPDKPDCGRHKATPFKGLGNKTVNGAPSAAPAPASAPAAPEAVEPDPATVELTPIPEELPLGKSFGTPILVGGADLVDGTATLTAFKHPATGEPVEVLEARITPSAEAKVLESLNLEGTTMVEMAKTVEVHDRLELDKAQQFWEDTEQLVKSYNHYAKQGQKMPDHRMTQLEGLMAKLKQADADSPGPMVDHYLKTAFDLQERSDPNYNVAYDEPGGKITGAAPFTATYEATVSEWVPVANNGEGHPTNVTGLRIPKPTFNADGSSSWDGKATKSMKGTQYEIDLGDGYKAWFTPHSTANTNSDDVSRMGTVFVFAPQGGGHSKQLVRKLGDMYLANKPMSKAEAEWVYLTENAVAQGVNQHPTVVEAAHKSAAIIDAENDSILHTRLHEAYGMNEDELARLSRDVLLEAETKSLPKRVKLLRDAVATTTGYTSGDALAKSPGYDPTPRVESGWLSWTRYDMPKGSAAFEATKQIGLHHGITGGSEGVLGMLRTGALASSDRRDVAGLPKSGISPDADKKSGGAQSVFLRTHHAGGGPGSGFSMEWEDAGRLMTRSDWYAYQSDHYGSINPDSHHSVSGMTRDPKKASTFASSSNNEIMFRNGIDIYGEFGPSKIHCGNATTLAEAKKIVKDKGVTHIGGRPVDQVLVL